MNDEEKRQVIESFTGLKKRLEAGDESALDELSSINGWGNTVESVLGKVKDVLDALTIEAEEMAQRRKKVEKERVKNHNVKHYSLNPDFSDIRLVPREEKEKDGEIVHGRWVKDHIEFYVKGWNWIYRNWVMFTHCLNHEVIHGVIGKILLEDNLDFDDCHFPFYAGMDMLFGWCYSHDHADYVSPIQIYEEAKAFNHNPTKIFMHFLGGDQ